MAFWRGLQKCVCPVFYFITFRAGGANSVATERGKDSSCVYKDLSQTEIIQIKLIIPIKPPALVSFHSE